MSTKCDSCGVEWLEHLGIIGTCAQNQRMMAALEAVLAHFPPSLDGRRGKALKSVLTKCREAIK